MNLSGFRINVQPHLYQLFLIGKTSPQNGVRKSPLARRYDLVVEKLAQQHFESYSAAKWTSDEEGFPFVLLRRSSDGRRMPGVEKTHEPLEYAYWENTDGYLGVWVTYR